MMEKEEQLYTYFDEAGMQISEKECDAKREHRLI